uniref:Uncharacterized protein n=1 Tax=Musca domestica TaxID=7370 RepID=A0A1I8M651_MUSDO
MSAKASNQPGRRTPLSLSGGVNKGQNSNNNRSGNNSANGHGNNNKPNQHQKTEQNQNNNQKQQQSENAGKGGHNNKQQTESKIPKPHTSQNSDNNKNQKQQQNAIVDNKKSTEKQQNGVAANGNKNNQQQSKDNKTTPQTSNDVTKTNDKKNEVVQNKPEKVESKTPTVTEKSEKEVPSPKENIKDQIKEDKKEETNSKIEENMETDKQIGTTVESIPIEDKNKDEQKDKVESMDVADLHEPQQEQQAKEDLQMSAPPTPKSVKENSKATTPNKTPNKSVEKTPTKKESSSVENTPKKANEKTPVKTTPTIREVTTAIDDVEMETLAVDQSPIKIQVTNEGIAPSATSTPGKIVLPKRTAAPKTDVQLAMQPSSSPERPRTFSQISGRRAIRPINEYTPSKFQSNPQFRESYRRINLELDATNTSLNVTVGSEIPNNSSFSFFGGRGRKRERTPPLQHSQSAIGEFQTDMEISPPKRARLDFFSVVSSPLSLLRNRFSKATLQSSTPVKLQQKLEEKEDDVEVQNVSGVSVHEDIEGKPNETEDNSATETTVGEEAIAAEDKNTAAPTEGELEIGDNGAKELPLKCGAQEISEDTGDIKITVTDNVAKNKRCIVM